MSKYFSFCAFLILCCAQIAAAQTTAKPMHGSEVLALTVGAALPENVAHDITVRGLNFHPDDTYRTYLKEAGADAKILAAFDGAKIVTADGVTGGAAGDERPDPELLKLLSSAAALMKDKRYDEAAQQLSNAVKNSFADSEAGFVMGELLCRREMYPQAAEVYLEVLHEDPTFPEVHTKLSYILYRLEASDRALNEAKAALAQNPEDAEAYKNAGLALEQAGKFAAAAAEFKEALRIKPDYTPVHYDLGILFHDSGDYDNAIVEYKKAIALDPNSADAHSNLGVTYKTKGDIGSAIHEYNEAKRLNPDDPMVRQNLASALMAVNPVEAITELRELEKMFPNFEVCHVCLGKALAWNQDIAGAEAEFLKAEQLDPSDSEPYSGLGKIQEDKKNYAAALEEYRTAERLAGSKASAHRDVGRILLAQKDAAGALAELKQAERLAPSDWGIHELYGQTLQASGEDDMAVAEFKEAVSIAPKQSKVRLELGIALEKKGDWVDALKQDRTAALDEAREQKSHLMGDSFLSSNVAREGYQAAQARYADHLRSLKASGNASEAAELEKNIQQMQGSPELSEKTELLLETADTAFKEKRYEDAEKSYKEAIELAKQLPTGDENLIAALGRLSNTYAMLRDYTDAGTTLHQELEVIEKTFGPESPRVTDPLRLLGSLACGLKDYVSAERYFSRALEINEKTFGEKSSVTAESLRGMAGLYELQNRYDKAEPYLVRAVKANEALDNDALVLNPLWGLCDVYDHLGKPQESQPYWHRATELMEKQVGQTSPDLVAGLTNEARALHRLGRDQEAAVLEERSRSIQNMAKTN
jgi:tetratricopeptide (TPR) repeat protein